MVADLGSGVVHHVADGKGKEAVAADYRGFSRSELAEVETVAMDMSGVFIAATREAVPEPDSKIAFDKFHVAMHQAKAAAASARPLRTDAQTPGVHSGGIEDCEVVAS